MLPSELLTCAAATNSVFRISRAMGEASRGCCCCSAFRYISFRLTASARSIATRPTASAKGLRKGKCSRLRSLQRRWRRLRFQLVTWEP